MRIDITGIYTIDQKESIKHRYAQTLGGKTIFIDSPESIIAHKLLFGSEQDSQDALAVYVRTEEKLDTTRLNSLVKRLDVKKEFKNLKEEIDRYKN